MDIDSFVAASHWAEKSLELLYLAELRVADGNQHDAKECLKCIGAFFLTYGQVLQECKDEQASVAEGQICMHGPSGVTYYSSIHDALLTIWGRVYWLSYQPELVVPDHLCEYLSITNQSQLRAGLIRERAKLVARYGSTIVNESPIQTVSAVPGKKPKAKSGRKSTAERDAQIKKEYYDGLEQRTWENQSDYLRQRHAARWKRSSSNAKAWLSTLLNRVGSVN